MHSSLTESPCPSYSAGPESRADASDPSLLEAIVESCDDAIMSLSHDGLLTSWNPAAERLYGHTRADILGHSPEILAPPDLIAEVAGLMARCLAGESVIDLETRRIAKDGTVLDISVTSSPIRNAEGRVCGICSVHRDIGERKRAQRRMEDLAADLERRIQSRTSELELANRDLREYAYTVAHDLRTPLRAIAGFASVLGESHAERLDSEGLRFLDVIRRNTEEVGKLIDSLLSVARHEEVQVDRAPVQMRLVVEECIAELEPERADRDVELLLGELPDCEAEPALLRTAWKALLSNAQKFTRSREHARIEIGAEVQDGGVVYFVRDNGVGFDMANAERIFGIFQRVHRPEEYDGMGVGLAMASRIIERHGGRIWARSEPGIGSTFHFTLGEK